MFSKTVIAIIVGTSTVVAGNYIISQKNAKSWNELLLGFFFLLVVFIFLESVVYYILVSFLIK